MLCGVSSHGGISEALLKSNHGELKMTPVGDTPPSGVSSFPTPPSHQFKKTSPSPPNEFDPIAEVDLHYPQHIEDEELGQLVSLERRGVTSHQEITQKEFWTSQTQFKFSVATKLREVGAIDLADGLELCHSRFVIGTCKGCGTSSKFANRCDRFYCPECQPRLSRKRKESVEWWTKQISQPKHVVLTLRNCPSLTVLHVRFLKESFARLRRSKFARGWRGGFYNIEVTNEKKGWHLHLHALIDAKWIDQQALSIMWDRSTYGVGRIVKVKDTRNKSYLAEVTKYAVKGSDFAAWPASDILKFISVFTGIRCFGVFGTLFGKRTEFAEWLQQLSARPACACGCNEIFFEDELNWEARFCRPLTTRTMPPPSLPRHLEFEFTSKI